MDRKSTGREHKNPERLGDYLDSYTPGGSRNDLSGTGKLQQQMGELFRLKRLWCSLMGERVSVISSPYRVKEGVLYVAVHDPMWIAELPYIKEDMLAKLAEAGLALSDIKFTISKIYRKAPLPPEKKRPVPKDQKLWAERLSTMISDEKTRKAYFKALIAYLQREKA